MAEESAPVSKADVSRHQITVCVPLAWASSVSAGNLHGVTCRSWTDSDSNVVPFIRRNLFELTKLGVLVRGRSDGW